jgi:hypothetical protein
MVVTFRAVLVFAEDQTTGKPLVEVCRRLSGDDPHGLFEALVQVAHSAGFSVADHEFDGEINGDCSPALRRIRVESRLSPAHRVKTLAHELAHGLLHGERTERGLMELEAESVAFVVCHALGIASDDWTLGCITTWSGGGEAAIAAIKTVGGRIQQAAHRILSALDEHEAPGRSGRARTRMCLLRGASATCLPGCWHRCCWLQTPAGQAASAASSCQWATTRMGMG